jgi:hypothetical protein
MSYCACAVTLQVAAIVGITYTDTTAAAGPLSSLLLWDGTGDLQPLGRRYSDTVSCKGHYDL